MEIRGKLLAGIVGMVFFDLTGMPLGGLWGFILGAMLGHVFFDRRRDFHMSEQEFRSLQRRRGEYLYHVFSLCAKMAKADGAVNQREVDLMERLISNQFRLTAQARQNVIRIWNDAKNSSQSFEHYARAFYLDFGRERHQVLQMMDLLFATAAADGRLHPVEEQLLIRAAGMFHIGRLQYDRIRQRYYQEPPRQPPVSRPSLQAYYQVLGAQPGEPLDRIKQRFRRLAMQWHPDKLLAQGASPEAIQRAKERFQQINEAYEKILEARK
ncbi:MAG: hypothetical protein EP344_15100 [Bacteroidetes bacterium]|nr:MAG: hypothetical protein EP344_15100 [Bacteroidota bacterium]